MAHDLSKFNRVPVDDIATPKPGRICYPESWWVVTPDNEVLFYTKDTSHLSPQCNQNMHIVERWLPSFPGCTMVHLPMVFLKHNCSDYV